MTGWFGRSLTDPRKRAAPKKESHDRRDGGNGLRGKAAPVIAAIGAGLAAHGGDAGPSGVVTLMAARFCG